MIPVLAILLCAIFCALTGVPTMGLILLVMALFCLVIGGRDGSLRDNR